MLIPEDIILAVLSSLLLGMAGGYPCCCPVDGSVFGSGSSIIDFPPPPPGSTSTSSPGITFIEGCAVCLDGRMSEYYQVEIPDGFTSQTAACTQANCDTLPGAYILGPTGFVFELHCGRQGDSFFPCDGPSGDTINFEAVVQTVPAGSSFEIQMNEPVGESLWRYNPVGDVDCLADLIVCDFFFSNAARCEYTGASQATASPIAAP